MGLEDDFVVYWDNFIKELRRGHIRVTKESDEFSWSMNMIGGMYITKLDLYSLGGIPIVK